ncbi:UNVERIFIED_CONTAM: hypothetical protein FKN15_044061 [Acipenser sinensis]
MNTQHAVQFHRDMNTQHALQFHRGHEYTTRDWLNEDLIYQSEDVFLRNKELRTARKQRAKVKRTQSVKTQPSLENAQHSQDISKMAAETLIHPPPDSRDNKGLTSD